MPRLKGQVKKVVRSKTAEDGTKVTSSVISTLATEEQAQTPPPAALDSVVESQEAVEEEAGEEEIQDLIRQRARMMTADALTCFLKEHYKLHYLAPVYNHLDSRFPFDDYKQMRVTRYYPSIGLMVDIVPADWKQEKIDAKKHAIEKIGFKYTWKKSDEHGFDPKTFFKRMEPLKEEPKFEFLKPGNQNRMRVIGVTA